MAFIALLWMPVVSPALARSVIGLCLMLATLTRRFFHWEHSKSLALNAAVNDIGLLC
jgi:hypothetical protein